MKPKPKFKFVNTLFYIFLIIAISVSVGACRPKRPPAPEPASNRAGTSTEDKPGELGEKPEEPNLSSQGKKSDVLPADLEGTWNASLICYSDTEWELPYALYELNFTFDNIAEHDYNVEITTIESKFADPDINPDVPPENFSPALIEDNTSARLEQDGILYLNFSSEYEDIFEISLQKENGNLIGRAHQTPETGLPEGGMYSYLELKKSL